MEKYRSKWLALFGICLLAFTAYLDFTIVNTALPYIQKDFQIDVLSLQWVANIYPILISMTMIAVGKLGDYFGQRKIFYLGTALFGLAALFAGLSSNFNALIAFRGVQGLGASIVFIISTAIIAETFEGPFKSQAIGIYGGITGIGLMLGPFFGGILIGLLGWRWVFFINIPIIAIGFLCCWASLKGTSLGNKNVHFDWKGLLLLIFGLGFLMFGIVGKHWIAIAVGVFALLTLIKIDLKSRTPLLYFSIFKDKLILLSILSCAIAGIISYVFMFFDPLYLENVRRLTPFEIGFMIAIIPAAQVVISFAFKTLVQWAGLANLLFVSSLSALFAVLFHYMLEEQNSLAYAILPFALLGINWGLSNTAMIAAVNQNANPTKIGESIGTIATIWNVNGSIFLAISTLIFSLNQNGFIPSFQRVIAFNAAFMALVIVFAIWTRKKITL